MVEVLAVCFILSCVADLDPSMTHSALPTFTVSAPRTSREGLFVSECLCLTGARSKCRPKEKKTRLVTNWLLSYLTILLCHPYLALVLQSTRNLWPYLSRRFPSRKNVPLPFAIVSFSLCMSVGVYVVCLLVWLCVMHTMVTCCGLVTLSSLGESKSFNYNVVTDYSFSILW